MADGMGDILNNKAGLKGQLQPAQLCDNREERLLLSNISTSSSQPRLSVILKPGLEPNLHYDFAESDDYFIYLF